MLSVSRVCKCFVHDYVRLAELSASPCSKIEEGLVLERKEEGSSELRRSFVLCGVRFLKICSCNRLTE
jgi:hypothetical protein